MPPTSPLPFPWKLPPETLPVIDYTFDVVCTLLSFFILPPSPPHPTNHSSWAYLPDFNPPNRPFPMIPPLLPLNISKTHHIFLCGPVLPTQHIKPKQLHFPSTFSLYATQLIFPFVFQVQIFFSHRRVAFSFPTPPLPFSPKLQTLSQNNKL